MKLEGQTIIIFGGKTGLLGQALTDAFEKTGAKPIPLSSKDCDILNPMEIERLLDKTDPDLIMNAAAYTQVDLAEKEEDTAFAINATAPPLLATHAAKRYIPFVHYSTDFVFKGDKRTPYTVYDEPGAFSVYGISKADGESNLLSCRRSEGIRLSPDRPGADTHLPQHFLSDCRAPSPTHRPVPHQLKTR